MALLDEIVDGRALVDQRWMLGAGEHIYEQLGGLIGARFTAAAIVRLAPRR